MTGEICLFRCSYIQDNKRTAIPVDDESVQNAIHVIEWAVQGILSGDFPKRACKQSCTACDFKALCSQQRQAFRSKIRPPFINTPTGPKQIAAFEPNEGGAE